MKANYYQGTLAEPVELDVIESDKDAKTATLGKGKDVKVSGCRVTEEPEPGACTIEGFYPKGKAKPSEDKKTGKDDSDKK